MSVRSIVFPTIFVLVLFLVPSTGYSQPTNLTSLLNATYSTISPSSVYSGSQGGTTNLLSPSLVPISPSSSYSNNQGGTTGLVSSGLSTISQSSSPSSNQGGLYPLLVPVKLLSSVEKGASEVAEKINKLGGLITGIPYMYWLLIVAGAVALIGVIG